MSDPQRVFDDEIVWLFSMGDIMCKRFKNLKFPVEKDLFRSGRYGFQNVFFRKNK